MRQMTIELDDDDMAQIEAAPRARHIDPERMSKDQLLKLLTMGKKPKWRVGLSARRHQLALKAAQTTPPTEARPHATNGARAHGVELDSGALDGTQADQDEATRAKRLAAIMKMHGIWKGDPDKPQDGLAYQLEVRAEWR